MRVDGREVVPVFIKEDSPERNSSIYVPGSYSATGSLVALTASPAYSETPTIQHILDSIAAAAGCEVYVVDRSSSVRSLDAYSIMPDNYRGAYRFFWDGQPGHNCMCTVERDGSQKLLMPRSDNTKRFVYSNSVWNVATNSSIPAIEVDAAITDNANFSFTYHNFAYSIANGIANLDIPVFNSES